MVTPDVISQEAAWAAIAEVKDPEIPVISVVELGLIREVEINGRAVQVTMTTTFSGCPALYMMQAEIRSRLLEAGAEQVILQVSHNPPWSTEDIDPAARQKLREFGLAPPPRPTKNLARLDPATCPYCGSQNTQLKNSFGPTLCRMIYVCNACRQPFEQFKPV
jgi:ring-1,2-phenylacetyl-CoA epoxidase subunit PaaD